MLKMNAETLNPQVPADHSDIETLAHETNTPFATVFEIYTMEHAKLDQAAKIKTYVPLLARRRVKELLQPKRPAPTIHSLNQPSA
jgi:Protein of unknown function (DUF3562)